MPGAKALAFALAVVLTLTAPSWAQLRLGTVKGVVLGIGGQPAQAATIELTDTLGSVIDSRSADSAGRFAFRNIAPGSYILRATTTDGGSPVIYPINVEGGVPIEATLQVTQISMHVDVASDAIVPGPSSQTLIGAKSLEFIPIRSTTQGIQNAVATLPGWSTEDNGLLHVRGTDDGFLYVIDGVPVYERLDQVSGLGPDLSTVASVNVITGYVPAEFGYKAGGVIDIRSKTFQREWATWAQVDRGTTGDTGGLVTASGPLGKRVTLTAGTAGQRSDRFLDPIDPDNLHNHGDVLNASSQLTWTRDAGYLIVSAGGGRSEFDIPNTIGQQEASQDQRQRISQRGASLSWWRLWAPYVYSMVAVHRRESTSALTGSPRDTPLFADTHRSLARWGAIASVGKAFVNHDLKAGVEIQRLKIDESFQFSVTDTHTAREAGFSSAVFAFDRQHPFVMSANASPQLWSAFAQHNWTISPIVQLSSGIRYDASRLLLSRHQWSPRVGLTYWTGDRTVFRASASRFFQPPQPENLLLSSSAIARQLSPFATTGDRGGAEIEPERQWMTEVGIDHRLGSLIRLDAAIWYRRIEQAADPNVFAGTTIIFPNAVAESRARGVEFRIEVPSRGSWSGYFNASLSRVRQKGPIMGGLFLEGEIAEIEPGVEFVPDHDQPVVLSGGLTWAHKRSGATMTLTSRHESGTPIERTDEAEDELQDRPGAEMVDFERGRVRPRTVASIQAEVPVWKNGRRSAAIRASVLNLFDERYAYNFGNPFSGTHFGAPRTASIAVRVKF